MRELNDKEEIVSIFYGIYGVGFNIAQEWYDKGYRNLDDIRKNSDILTEDQKIGLLYYDVNFYI